MEPMRLLARLKKKRSETEQGDKKQPRPRHDETLESRAEKLDVKATRKERWIIRKRQANGTLKHLKTLTFKPTKNDLEDFGPGAYSVQKSTGGKFSKSERITIDETPHEPRSRGLPALDRSSGRPDGPPTTEYRRPPQAPKKLPSPSTTPPSDHRREKTVSDAIKRPSLKVKSDRPSSTDDRSRLSTDDGRKQDIESIVKRISELLDPEVKSASAVGAKGKSAIASKRETQDHGSAGSSTRRLQLDSQPERGTVDAHSVRPLEDVRLKDGSKPPPQAPTTNSKSVPELKEEKKYISCTKCGDSICEENELWSFKYSGRRCEYCHLAYCRECFGEHVCPSSVVCSHCGKRFSTALDVFQAEYCQKPFCSRRCANLCFRKNKDTPECQGCGNREDESEEKTEEDADEEVEEGPEDAEEGDQDEGEEWWYLPCSNCDILIRNDDPTNIECMDCEEEFFCSWSCFKRYHQRKRLDHEGMTFGESYDWEEERSR